MKTWTSLIAGLGMAASLLAAVPAGAQTYSVRVGDTYEGTALDFNTAPRMVLIPDSRVYYVRENNFDNDLYRFGGQWYFVDNGNWYRANSWRGPFVNIRSRDVPMDVYSVPTEYRTSWSAGNGSTRYTGRATMRTGERYRGTSYAFRTRPRMARVPGTRVEFNRNNIDQDMYRFGNRWYFVEDGNWYQARSWRGPYTYVSFNNVPYDVRNVPTDYRRAWTNNNNDDRDYRPGYMNTSSRFGQRYNGNGSFRLDSNSTPRMAVVPNTDVYYLTDDSDVDLYHYGSDWYLVDNGTWYRANSWRGPFLSISQNSAPRAVVRIPSGYRKTWVSPTGY